MNLEQQKERALTFLKGLEKPDATGLPGFARGRFRIRDDGPAAGVAPIRGKEAFLKSTPPMLRAMFPNGLNIKLISVIAEGPHVAVQAESDTTAGNGKKYANRYHFYVLFKGDKIAQVREYNDTNHVREVFMS